MLGLGIESLEIDPNVGILQEATFEFSEEVCPLCETTMDGIRALPYGFEIPLFRHFMGLIIDEDEVPLIKGAWVDVGFIMRF